MKKIASALVISSLLLTGCFGGNDEEKKSDQDGNARTKTYESVEFSLTIPETWEVIEPQNFSPEISSETLVIFRNNVKNPEFTANVNITRTLLTQPISSEDYAKRLQATASSLLNYQDLGREALDKTVMLTYEGKRSPEQSVIRFSQIPLVKGTSAYVITGARLPAEDPVTEKLIQGILKSFAVK